MCCLLMRPTTSSEWNLLKFVNLIIAFNHSSAGPTLHFKTWRLESIPAHSKSEIFIMAIDP